MVVTGASLICEVTTLILTVKNSCSYLKAMHYVVPISITDSDWLSSDETNKQNALELAKVLKKLPVRNLSRIFIYFIYKFSRFPPLKVVSGCRAHYV